MPRLPLLLAASLALAAGACRSPSRPPAEGPAPSVRVDSLSLERTVCFGFCPAYLVVLRADGAVRFESRNPRDTAYTAADTVPPARVAALGAEAERIGFWRLPDEIMGSEYCEQVATDLPGAVVTIWSGGRTKRVNDYHGCFGEKLKPLRAFEARIDSVAGSSRWARPSTIR